MKCGKILPVETAAAKAGFSARTGYRLQRVPQPPSASKFPRGSRRLDSLAEIILREVVLILQKTPELRPAAIVHELQRRHPQLKDGVRLTLERRVSPWKAVPGPDRLVIFPQTKVTERLEISDFTALGRLGITLNQKKLDYLLDYFRLPWSGLMHANVVLGGESFSALTEGLPRFLRTLGGAPQKKRTDSLSTAFRNLSPDRV